MGFPHLPRPPAPSLELWVQTFSCQKRPCGLGKFFFSDIKTVTKKFPSEKNCIEKFCKITERPRIIIRS